MHGEVSSQQRGGSVDLWPAKFYPRPVWDFLGHVIPGLLSFWTHKIEQKAKKRRLMYEQLVADGTDPDDADEQSMAANKVGIRTLDLYVWAVLLGNTALAKVLLATCADPMRASILGARLCNYMADLLPIERQGLEEAADEHQKFAITLLDLCPNQNDAALLLLAPTRHWQRSVMELAVNSEMKRFLAHRHCQNLIDHSLHGDVGEYMISDTAKAAANPLSLKPSCAMLPYRFQRDPQGGDELLLLLHAICPCILTLRRAPSATREPTLGDFYNIPYVKQVLRKTMHMMYVVLFSLAVVGERVVPDIYWGLSYYLGGLRPAWLLAWWTAALVLDEWNQWVVNPATFEVDLWNKYDYISLSSSSVALLLKLGIKPIEAAWATARATFLNATLGDDAVAEAADAASYGRLLKAHGGGAAVAGDAALGGTAVADKDWTLHDVDNLLLAVVNVLVWCRVLQHFSTSRDVGVLIIMIIEMASDMRIWILLSVIFTFAFMFTFAAITDDSVDDSAEPYHALAIPIWAMFGEFDLQWTSDNSGVVGQITLWIYVLVSNVLLVNLLIAMMSDTYQEIKENADIEWKFSRVSSILEAIERTHPIPPPFSFPFMVARLVRWAIFGAFNRGPSQESLEADEAAAWRVGGRLYTIKRKREKIAKRTLQHYQRQQDEEAEGSSDGRLKRIEKLVEELLVFSEDQEREIQHLQKDLKENHTAEMQHISHLEQGAHAKGGAPPAMQHGGKTNREILREAKLRSARSAPPEVKA